MQLRQISGTFLKTLCTLGLCSPSLIAVGKRLSYVNSAVEHRAESCDAWPVEALLRSPLAQYVSALACQLVLRYLDGDAVPGSPRVLDRRARCQTNGDWRHRRHRGRGAKRRAGIFRVAVGQISTPQANRACGLSGGRRQQATARFVGELDAGARRAVARSTRRGIAIGPSRCIGRGFGVP